MTGAGEIVRFLIEGGETGTGTGTPGIETGKETGGDVEGGGNRTTWIEAGGTETETAETVTQAGNNLRTETGKGLDAAVAPGGTEVTAESAMTTAEEGQGRRQWTGAPSHPAVGTARTKWMLAEPCRSSTPRQCRCCLVSMSLLSQTPGKMDGEFIAQQAFRRKGGLLPRHC